MRLPSRATLLVSGLATSVVLSGCVGAKSAEDKSDPKANADAKDVTLVISANDVVGGKNAAEASWITDPHSIAALMRSVPVRYWATAPPNSSAKPTRWM